jgi:hypothetical protein
MVALISPKLIFQQHHVQSDLQHSSVPRALHQFRTSYSRISALLRDVFHPKLHLIDSKGQVNGAESFLYKTLSPAKLNLQLTHICYPVVSLYWYSHRCSINSVGTLRHSKGPLGKDYPASHISLKRYADKFSSSGWSDLQSIQGPFCQTSEKLY